VIFYLTAKSAEFFAKFAKVNNRKSNVTNVKYINKMNPEIYYFVNSDSIP